MRLRVEKIVLLALFATEASAQTTEKLEKALEGFGVTERLGARVPGDVEMITEGGRAVRFADHLGGPPLLLTLNYTDCPMLCSLQLAGLAKAIAELGPAPGKDYVALSLSIDPEEPIAKAEHAKRRYVAQARGREGIEGAWRFHVASAEAIARVADAVGFRFRHDPATGEYHHQATLIVLTPDGRVSRYLHGISYPTRELADALRRAAKGEVASADEQRTMIGFLLNCLSFDPDSNTPRALLAMRVGGILTVLGLAFLIGVYGFRGRRESLSK